MTLSNLVFQSFIYYYFNDQLTSQVKNNFIKNKSANPYNSGDGKLLFIPHTNTTHFGTKSLRYNSLLPWNNFSQSMNNYIFLMQAFLNLLRSIFCFILDISFFTSITTCENFRTDTVAIFKLVCVYSWSPSNQTLLKDNLTLIIFFFILP